MSAAGQNKADLIAALARSDARFDGRDFDGLSRAERQRYLDRSAAGLAALASEPEPQPVAEEFDAGFILRRLEARRAASPHLAETAPDQEGQTDGR